MMSPTPTNTLQSADESARPDWVARDNSCPLLEYAARDEPPHRAANRRASTRPPSGSKTLRLSLQSESRPRRVATVGRHGRGPFKFLRRALKMATDATKSAMTSPLAGA